MLSNSPSSISSAHRAACRIFFRYRKTMEGMKMNELPTIAQFASYFSCELTPQHLRTLCNMILRGIYWKEERWIKRAVSLAILFCHNLSVDTLSEFLSSVLLPGSKAHSDLFFYVLEEDDEDDEDDSDNNDFADRQYYARRHLLLEIEIYCYLLVIIFLMNAERYEEAKDCSSTTVARLKNISRWTIDFMSSKIYFYYSYSHELTNSLAEIRGNLFALHRKAILRHDELNQETLLNLLLRNYLHYNLYDQAEKLGSKAPRFKGYSNAQLCRYLFYLGKIRTIRLEYTDAKESLLQAARKAPMAAKGFIIECNKWAIMVRLLLGEIPERSVFMQKGMKKALVPYFHLANAVRTGSLELLRIVAVVCSSSFSLDKTNNLIVRLRHNVIRAGLHNISLSYSRISLADVAKKLRFDSKNPAADVESIIAKAIHDGVIDVTIDHANGWMQTKENGDIYSTNEPHVAFHNRIVFCLNLHNEVVKLMRFPPSCHK